MGTIISLIGRKGGITKTTLTINLAAGCALNGYRTIVIDADGQGNASSGMQVEPRDALYHVVADEGDWADAITRPAETFLNQPSELYLVSTSNANRLLEENPQTPAIFMERIEEIRNWADVIFIDTSPGITSVHTASYFASDFVLLPTTLGYASIDSLRSTFGYLQQAKEAGKRAGVKVAEVMGLVINLFAASKNVHRDNNGYLRGKYEDTVPKIFEPIRNLTVWEQASQWGQSIYTYAPENDYNAARSARSARAELDPVLEHVMGVLS